MSSGCPDSAIYGRLDHRAFALGRPPLVDYGIRRYAIGSRRRKLLLVHAVGLRRYRRGVGEDRGGSLLEPPTWWGESNGGASSNRGASVGGDPVP
jgi:hypothetical protein